MNKKRLYPLFITVLVMFFMISGCKNTTEPKQTVNMPLFKPVGGTYSSPQIVTISCSTSDVVIRFTTNGSEPTESSTQYSGHILVNSTMTIKAKAYRSNWTPSSTASATYTITASSIVAPPTFNPVGGSYNTSQNVTLSCDTPESVIRYTINGSEPTESSTQYSSPISVNSTMTIKARAYRSNWTPSQIASATYTITASSIVAPPTFNPVGGSYNTSQNVTLSCDTPESVIRYTINGSEPTESSTQYSGLISVNSTTTIKAKAYRSNWTPSPTASATYTINVVAPGQLCLVAGGTFKRNGCDVTLDSFYIGQCELTQKEWLEVMDSNPSYNKGDNYPVERVTWFGALYYCNMRSIKEGLTPCYSINGTTNPSDWTYGTIECNWNADGYRLPTEAEWEYAARGGSLSQGYYYSGSNNLGEVAWYRDNSGNKSHPVGEKVGNELGLYDMTGNVYEWCWDWYAAYPSSAQDNPKGPNGGTHRISRGSSYLGRIISCQVGERVFNIPTDSYYDLGFRLCRTSR